MVKLLQHSFSDHVDCISMCQYVGLKLVSQNCLAAVSGTLGCSIPSLPQPCMVLTQACYVYQCVRQTPSDQRHALHGPVVILSIMNAYRAEETDEQQCPCPFCGVAGPETEMDCIHCQNIIPFCIASGEHAAAM